MKRQTIETLVCLGIIAIVGVLAVAAGINLCRHGQPKAVIETSVTRPAPTPAAEKKPDATPLPAVVAAHQANLALLTAQWCAPCQRLRWEVLPLLTDIPIQMVEVDAERDLANTLFAPKIGQCVPQFVLYDRTPQGDYLPWDWLVGYHTAEQVREFLTQSSTKFAERPVKQEVSKPAAIKALIASKLLTADDPKDHPKRLCAILRRFFATGKNRLTAVCGRVFLYTKAASVSK